MENKLEVWKRKVFRSIYGGKFEDGAWRRRVNKKVFDLYRQPNIAGAVRAQRTRWLGHLVCLPGDKWNKSLGQGASHQNRLLDVSREQI